MIRWLVTGAGGMLGTNLVAALTSRGEPVTGMDRASLDVTDAAAVTDAIAGNGLMWWSTARPGPPLTTPRRPRNRRSRSTPAARPTWPRPARRSAPAWCSCRPTTSSPGTQASRTPRTISGAVYRLRTHQAGRRAGRARPLARVGLRGQDGMAVRGARAELCPHHDQACGPAADGRRSGRPARPAHLDRRRRRADHRSGPFRGRAGHLPRHEQRADDLVRAGTRDLQPARRRSGPGKANTEQRAAPAGPAARLQCAGSPRLGGIRDLAFRLSANGGWRCIALFPNSWPRSGPPRRPGSRRAQELRASAASRRLPR